jgi:hypothetical protein
MAVRKGLRVCLFSIVTISGLPKLLPLMTNAQTSLMSMPTVGSVSAPVKTKITGGTYQALSTKRMAERLRAVYAATDWKLDPNKAATRVTYYEAR